MDNLNSYPTCEIGKDQVMLIHNYISCIKDKRWQDFLHLCSSELEDAIRWESFDKSKFVHEYTNEHLDKLYYALTNDNYLPNYSLVSNVITVTNDLHITYIKPFETWKEKIKTILFNKPAYGIRVCMKRNNKNEWKIYSFG